MRRLFGGNRQSQPERYDPWDRLVAEAPVGVAEARATVARAASVAAPGLGGPEGKSVTLGARDAGPVLETFIGELSLRSWGSYAPSTITDNSSCSRGCAPTCPSFAPPSGTCPGYG